jgi:small subunit ribosomal protein S21
MIVVKVKGKGSLDKSLKELKRKFEKSKIVKELRERQSFKKKSEKKRERKKKAVYIQKKYRNED